MSNQIRSQGSHSDYDLDDECYQAILDAAEQGWDALLDATDQPGNPYAEALWAMEKKKALQQEEQLKKEKKRNTRHSVDKGEDFIKSGMTLITDVDSDKYLNRVDK